MSLGKMGTSGSKNKSWYKPAEPYLNQFMDVGNRYLNQWDPKGGQFRKTGEGEMLATERGDYLTPESNPALQNTLGLIQADTANYGNTAARMAGVRDTGNAVMDAANRGSMARQQGLGEQYAQNRIAQLLLGNYGGEKANQLNMSQAAIAQSQAAEQNALEIAKMFGGMNSGKSQSTPSFFGGVM